MVTRRNPGACRQAGLSMIGFLLVAILGAMGVLVGFKVAPAYIEYYSLKNVLKTIVGDPEMRDATVADIRRSFERRAMIADVKVVQGADLEITKSGGTITVGTAYSVKVPLAGNVSACLDFEAVAQR